MGTDMIEFGKTLRATREARGLSTSEIAQRTHMLIQHVEALEREDFSKIAAPIYGRGFVKLYCEALGIDPQPFIKEFMDMYTGNKKPTIRMRETGSRTSSPPPLPPTPPPLPVHVDPPLDEPLPIVPPELREAVCNPPPAAAPEPPPESPAPEPAAAAPAPEPEPDAPEAPVAAPDDFALEQESAPIAPAQSPFSLPNDEPPLTVRPISCYATPAPSTARKPSAAGGVPPFVWRIAALAIAAGLVLWLLIIGVRAVYRATMGTDGGAESAEAPAAEVESPAAPEPTAAPPAAAPVPAQEPTEAAAPAPGQPRTPMKLPPLYID